MTNLQNEFDAAQLERAMRLEMAISEIMHAGYCTVCGCNAAECGGLTDVGDLDPDTDACRCWDDELGEPVC